jgi:micrococcal nuclease
VILLLLACKPPNVAPQADPAVVLDGQPIVVSWDDGDTFHSPRPDGEKLKARLAGFNTLESYGPVHSWGDWTPEELYGLATDSGRRAASQVWECTTLPGGGGYGRELVDCPGLRDVMLREGYAHIFLADEGSVADPADLEAQHEAQAEGRGMWAKGVPAGIITSLHSLDEKKDQESTYNRVADTKTGLALKVDHTESYRSCQKVCMDEAESCMIYVPYRERYGDGRAICLQ